MTASVNPSNNCKQCGEDKAQYCSLPVVPDRQLDANIDPNRESLIRYIEKKWVNYTVLHYHFLAAPGEWQGDESQKQVVRESFTAWKNLGIGLEFRKSVNQPMPRYVLHLNKTPGRGPT